MNLKRALLSPIIVAVAVFVMVRYDVIPGVTITPYAALVLALLMAVLSLVVRPILVMLRVPIILFTYWIFTVVINTAIFWFVATFVKGFEVEGLYGTEGILISILSALLISAVQSINQKIFE